MKIVADKHIPFLEGVFEPYAEVVYIDGREINHNDIIDADALVIRTRTRCNAALLEGTKVSMIATATIGMDHIDLEYCRNRNIEVYNAQGCNAGGVMQYVFSAHQLRLQPPSKKKRVALPSHPLVGFAKS